MVKFHSHFHTVTKAKRDSLYRSLYFYEFRHTAKQKFVRTIPCKVMQIHNTLVFSSTVLFTQYESSLLSIYKAKIVVP